MKEIPAWIEESIYPRATDNRRPLLDIYAEQLRIQRQLNEMEHRWNVRMDEILGELRALQVATWYQRFYHWLQSMGE